MALANPEVFLRLDANVSLYNEEPYIVPNIYNSLTISR